MKSKCAADSAPVTADGRTIPPIVRPAPNVSPHHRPAKRRRYFLNFLGERAKKSIGEPNTSRTRTTQPVDSMFSEVVCTNGAIAPTAKEDLVNAVGK